MKVDLIEGGAPRPQSLDLFVLRMFALSQSFISDTISFDTLILMLPSYLTLIVDRGRPDQLAFVKGLLHCRLDAGSHLGWPMGLCPR